jgi:hypothetical protein
MNKVQILDVLENTSGTGSNGNLTTNLIYTSTGP